MNYKRIARNVEQRFGGDIARLFGVEQQSVRFKLGTDVPVAATSGNVITINPNYAWQDRADVRGALIHELTHAYGVRAGTDKVETAADAARYLLNPKETAGWTPSAEVKKLAGKVDMGAYDSNGPSMGADGHHRNTVTNNASKASRNPGLPVLGPAFAAAQAQQAAGLQSSLMTALAQIKAAKGQIRGQFTLEKQGAKSQQIADIAHVVNDSMERGVRGASFTQTAEAGTLADRAAAIEAARMTKASGLQEQGFAGLQAVNQYNLGLAGLSADKAAQQQAAALELYKAQAYDSQMKRYNELYKRLLANLRARGARGTSRVFGNAGSNGTIGAITPGGYQTGGGF